MGIQLPPGARVISVGTDIIEVERVRSVMERHGDRFLKRVFTEGERDYCLGMKNPHPHLAARFAAKEAVSKAFTTGIGAELSWTSIEVVKGVRAEPLIVLDSAGERLLLEVGGTRVIISLSHTANHAMAVALLLA